MTFQILTGTDRAQVKFFPRIILLALLAVLLPACGNLAGADAAAEAEGAHVTLDVEKFTISENAEMDYFVGAIDDELFIGVAVGQEGGGEGEARPVAVYLCDSQMVSQWINGEITGQQGTLVAGESGADVTISGDSVSGTVVLDGGEPRPFTAEPANDDAGVYRAVVSQGGVDFRLDWVVLNDGRQRGPMDGKGNDPYPVDLN